MKSCLYEILSAIAAWLARDNCWDVIASVGLLPFGIDLRMAWPPTCLILVVGMGVVLGV